MPATRLDYAGALTLAVSAGCVLGGFTIAARSGWGGATLGIVAVGLVASIMLIPIERHAASPLFDPAIVGPAPLRVSLVSLTATYVVFYGTLVAIPFIVRDQLHQSTAIAGVVTMAVPAGLVTIATVTASVRRRWSSRRIIQMGASIHVLATGGVAVARTMTELVVSLAVLGAAIGLMNTTSNQVIMDAVTGARRGIASGTVNLVRNAGSAAGMALVATLLAGSHRVGHDSPRWLFLPVVSVAVVPWLLSWWPTKD
jgi:predicted MFS family arabinose efflux permease